MLLLYPPTAPAIPRHPINLHSTMLLLYPSVNFSPFSEISIYIPLCFYFISDPVAPAYTEGNMHLHSTLLLLYPDGWHKRTPLHSNLHSTMLLLYQEHVDYKRLIEKFTFHYASTLSDCIVFKNHICIIYIPLCFYFIGKTAWGMCRSPASIYIPLCFYFIGQRRVYRNRQSDIYIPLCFYFIPFLFSPLISCSSDLYFVHLLFSLYFHFKNILVKSPKCNFTLAVRALSTYWKFYTISSRQLEKVARFIIIHTPELFRNPLFISAFKNN